ncbi:MAG: hydroxymethylbilane synthase [Wenzhouxiangella sp.]|nr:hydroxymethylbilane synthase [Wenzhouxiangella sp.]TVR96947.1 MAG: hydroxymethylbilane synthase [Wenzhouxiangellaceae bacterium]
MKALKLATRKSRLALWQSEFVASALRQAHAGLEVDLVPMSTRGDEVLDRSLAEIGGKGLFLKELESALLDRRADIAVHSLKDVPAESPAGLVLAAVLPRADWSDLWIDAGGVAPWQMPPGSKVGTSSLRRQSQLLRAWPHLQVVPVRGNVETRLGLLHSGRVDAVILAAAGIDRLDIALSHRRVLGPPEFLPAPGQGVIVIQCREDDGEIMRLLEAVHCPATQQRVSAERGVVAALGGDCRMPLAALAELTDGSLNLRARLASPDGQECLDAMATGSAKEASALGRQVASALLDQGALRLLSHL